MELSKFFKFKKKSKPKESLEEQKINEENIEFIDKKNDGPKESISEDELSMLEKKIDIMSRGGKYISEKKNLAKMLMMSIMFNITLVVVLIFFSISFASVMNNRDVSVLIPPGTHQDLTLSFGSTRVSRSVFEIYADYLARGFGNFNYENVDHVFDNLIQYADGSVKHQMRLILTNKAHIVKENFVTQTFKLQRVELDRDSRGTLAKCYGYATRQIGNQKQFENMPYLMTFWFKSYRGNASIVGMSSRINKSPLKPGEKLKVDEYETDNKYINF